VKVLIEALFAMGSLLIIDSVAGVGFGWCIMIEGC